MHMADGCTVDGFLSKAGYGSGRNLGDRQFFFVNGRPVDLPKVSKLVNELYRGANSRQYPIAIMNFTIPTGACDVNVTPDKRKIFFSDEGIILLSLREALEKIYSPNYASYSVNKFDELSKEEIISKVHAQQEGPKQPTNESPEECSKGKGTTCDRTNGDSVLTTEKKNFNDFSMSPGAELRDLESTTMNRQVQPAPEILTKASNYYLNSPCRPNVVQSSLNKYVTVHKRKHESSGMMLSEVPVLRNGPSPCPLREHKKSAKHCTLSGSPINSMNIDDSDEVNDDGTGHSNASRDDKVSIGTEPLFSYGGNIQKGESKEVCYISLQDACSVIFLRGRKGKIEISENLYFHSYA